MNVEPFFGVRLNLDPSAEQLGEAARDVEAEPRSAVPPRQTRVELCERLEQRGRGPRAIPMPVSRTANRTSRPPREARGAPRPCR